MSPTLLVTCIGGPFGGELLQALRQDQDLGSRLIGADSDGSTVQRLFADGFHQVPSAVTAPEAFVEELLRVAQQVKADLVLPGADEEVLAVSRERKRFEELGVACPVAPPESLELLRDKGRLFQRLQDLGVPVPRFALLDKAGDLERSAAAMGYPGNGLVLKPRTGRGARGIIVVDPAVQGLRTGLGSRGHVVGDVGSVAEWLGERPAPWGLLGMEFLPGPAYDVDCIARSGAPVATLVRRRTWRDPFSPRSEGCRIERHDVLEQAVHRMVRALHLVHALDFDMGTTATGAPGLMEINPRLSGAAAAGLAAGVNVPALLVRTALGLPLLPAEARFGATMVPVQRMVFLDADGRLGEPSGLWGSDR